MAFRRFTGRQSFLKVRRSHLLHVVRPVEGWMNRTAIGKQQSKWNANPFAPAEELKTKIRVAVKDDIRPTLANGPHHGREGRELFRGVAIASNNLPENRRGAARSGQIP